MRTPDRFSQLIQYTAAAARTAKDIAESSNIPFLRFSAVLSLSIAESIQSVKSNKDGCVDVMDAIHEILCAVISLCTTTETNGTLGPAILEDIGTLNQTLQKVYLFVKSQQSMGRIKRLFKQAENVSRLEACDIELRQAIDRFKVQLGVSNAMAVSRMQGDVQKRHEELMELLETHSSTTQSAPASAVTSLMSSQTASSASISLLPAPPQIFHGRNKQVQEIVDILQQDSPRIAILGTGGIGKTALATSVLHHAVIAAKFPLRYFVPCQSVLTSMELISTVAVHIDMDEGPNLTKRIISHFSEQPASLLVFDNFESTWEPMASRHAVEEFLSLLDDISHLAILITMRGTERPAKVKWTRPFFNPLKPLDYFSALQIFHDIADENHEEEAVRELLGLTDNLPLAVTLMANVVAFEGCDATLSRWRTEKTRLLSDGDSNTSSLHTSILVSLYSIRTTDDARELLALLSFLPDGLSDAELLQSRLPLPNILTCKATLIQTSLAYIDQNQRIKVLVPVREHIQLIHTVSESMKLTLRRYFHEILDLWNKFETGTSREVSMISSNLGNFNAVFSESLRSDCADMVENFRSIFHLNHFLRLTNRGGSPLMRELRDRMNDWLNNPVFGDYIIERFNSSREDPISDREVTMGNRFFENASEMEKGNAEMQIYLMETDASTALWYNTLADYYISEGHDMSKALHFATAAVSPTSTSHPNKIGHNCLRGLALVLDTVGNHAAAKIHAQKAQEYAEILGDILGQARAMVIEARCCVALSDFKYAGELCEKSRELLSVCGLEGSHTDMEAQIYEAEIHLQKTEYVECRAMYAASVAAAAGQPLDYRLALAQINLALIDIEMSTNLDQAKSTLDTVRLQCSTTLDYPLCVAYCDMLYGSLYLAHRNTMAAKQILEQSFQTLRDVADEGAIMCLEKLADINHGMSDFGQTLRWTGVYLATATKTRNNLATIKALHFFGKLFVAQGDDETSLSLFQTSLDGFTLMGVHRGRADCMTDLGDVFQRRGDINTAVRLWTSARPLFEISSQRIRIDEVDSKLSEAK
ncbi:hypothetical protein C8R44DRAFT_853823 [Mycena epipterygia]|nr:hypothetical protein C8R44DRAFT_853823 [Mycena epipterygia]